MISENDLNELFSKIREFIIDADSQEKMTHKYLLVSRALDYLKAEETAHK